MMMQQRTPVEAGCEVQFTSLSVGGRAMTFPCDALGHVDLDALPTRALHNYLFARAMIGMEYSLPRVHRSALSA